MRIRLKRFKARLRIEGTGARDTRRNAKEYFLSGRIVRLFIHTLFLSAKLRGHPLS